MISEYNIKRDRFSVFPPVSCISSNQVLLHDFVSQSDNEMPFKMYASMPSDTADHRSDNYSYEVTITRYLIM